MSDKNYALTIEHRGIIIKAHIQSTPIEDARRTGAKGDYSFSGIKKDLDGHLEMLLALLGAVKSAPDLETGLECLKAFDYDIEVISLGDLEKDGEG